MDQNALVEDGDEGLIRILEAFASRGLNYTGIYLIALISNEGAVDNVIRLISASDLPNQNRDMIYELVRLRRDNKLPWVDTKVRFSVVSESDMEAARLIDYVQQLGKVPTIIRDSMWKGLFIEYALVAKIPQSDFAVTG